MNREQLTAELLTLQAKNYRKLSATELARALELSRILCECTCRQCGKLYDRQQSRAVYTGYCSAKCMNAKAKELGYRKGDSLYHCLRNADQVGDIWTVPPEQV